VNPNPTADVVFTDLLALEWPDSTDVEVLEVLPPDPATMDLAEAPRIIGGGAGLMAEDAQARFVQLAAVGEAIGASMGATRVVTDAGWVGHERQIGTTGVAVDPDLYLAFGISGAVQHTAGLGHPDHIVSVNVDQHCPMMAMADLAVVADAPAVLAALAERLGVVASGESTNDV
jgi:electron transfer flavoprotein alpha subunit